MHEVQAGCELLVLGSEVWDRRCAPHTAKGHKILTVLNYACQEVLVSNLKSYRILKRLCKVLGSIAPPPPTQKRLLIELQIAYLQRAILCVTFTVNTSVVLFVGLWLACSSLTYIFSVTSPMLFQVRKCHVQLRW